MRLELSTNYRPFMLANTGVRSEDNLYYHPWYKAFVNLAEFKIFLKYIDIGYQKNEDTPP